MKKLQKKLTVISIIFTCLLFNLAPNVNGQVPTDSIIVQLEKFIKDNPKDHIAFFNLGTAYLNKNIIQKAIENYKKTIAIKPDFAEAHN